MVAVRAMNGPKRSSLFFVWWSLGSARMNGQQLAVIGVLLLVGVGGAAVPGAGHPATSLEAGAPADQGTTASNNTTMGAQISSFMQTSAAETEGGVESGMWQAKFENAPSGQRDALVTKRVDSLEKRLQKLEARRAALLDGENVTMAERARAARLATRAESLRDAINGTARAADQAGVNTTKLDELRTRARNLTGEKTARLAPGKGPAGTPPGNRTAGPARNETDTRGHGPTNRTDGTPTRGSAAAPSTPTSGHGPNNASSTVTQPENTPERRSTTPTGPKNASDRHTGNTTDAPPHENTNVTTGQPRNVSAGNVTVAGTTRL